MFGIAQKLLIAKQLRIEEGEMRLVNELVTIIPLAAIAEITKELQNEGQENSLYRGAKLIGGKWFENMYKNFRISKTDVAKWGSDIVTLAGWGVTRISDIDMENKQMIVQIEKSTLGKMMMGSKNPVDHIVRGLIAGAADFFFGVNDMEGVETKCIAKGDPLCEFVFKRRDKFDWASEIVKKQLG